MKATMMKVSDPIIFGHCVEAYLGDLMEEYGEMLERWLQSQQWTCQLLPSIRFTRCGDSKSLQKQSRKDN